MKEELSELNEKVKKDIPDKTKEIDKLTDEINGENQKYAKDKST